MYLGSEASNFQNAGGVKHLVVQRADDGTKPDISVDSTPTNRAIVLPSYSIKIVDRPQPCDSLTHLIPHVLDLYHTHGSYPRLSRS
jgi:hypothetical protein